MKVKETFLRRCFVIEPNIFTDKGSKFIEIFNEKNFYEKIDSKTSFVQESQSFLQRGFLRELHQQKEEWQQAKLIRVIKGRVLAVVLDYREGSSTFGQYYSVELSGDNNKQLFIPKGFLYGFSTLEDNTILSCKADNFYNKDSEFGIIHNDKTLNIEWGLKDNEIKLLDKKFENYETTKENIIKKNKTVITYGTFDLLHYGHIEILKRASRLGDRLIVAVSTDEFNKEKGKTCKIPYAKRKEFLQSLDFVYHVIPETNWDQKIKDVKYYNADVFVMGDDWKGKFDFLKEYCKVIYLPRTVDISTTRLKEAFLKNKPPL